MGIPCLVCFNCCQTQFCYLNLFHFFQANWYLEWHLDVLILWALTHTGEISKAEELLKGLKSRWNNLPLAQTHSINRYLQCIDSYFGPHVELRRWTRRSNSSCRKQCWFVLIATSPLIILFYLLEYYVILFFISFCIVSSKLALYLYSVLVSHYTTYWIFFVKGAWHWTFYGQ